MLIETNRLKLYPATRAQMEAVISAKAAPELQKAYREMLEGCLRHPDQWEWYAMWMIELRDGTHVGDLCFKGLDASGTAEIGYGILEEYQGQGYILDITEQRLHHEIYLSDARKTAPEKLKTVIRHPIRKAEQEEPCRNC